MSVVSKVREFLACERGTPAIEYVLAAAGVAGTIVITFYLMGGNVTGLYEDVQTGFTNGGR